MNNKRRNIIIFLIIFVSIVLIFIVKNNRENQIEKLETRIVAIESYQNESSQIDSGYKITLKNIKIGIVSNSDKTVEIILNTEKGCSRTGFNIKKAFYEDEQFKNNVFIVNDDNEFSYIKERYFELPDFNISVNEFWKEYILVFVIDHYTGGTKNNNERIEIINDNYIFIIENWHKIDSPLAACKFIKLYILQVPKN